MLITINAQCLQQARMIINADHVGAIIGSSLCWFASLISFQVDPRRLPQQRTRADSSVQRPKVDAQDLHVTTRHYMLATHDVLSLLALGACDVAKHV